MIEVVSVYIHPLYLHFYNNYSLILYNFIKIFSTVHSNILSKIYNRLIRFKPGLLLRLLFLGPRRIHQCIPLGILISLRLPRTHEAVLAASEDRLILYLLVSNSRTKGLVGLRAYLFVDVYRAHDFLAVAAWEAPEVLLVEAP